jgi:ketosteroid isomerase-like protein
MPNVWSLGIVITVALAGTRVASGAHVESPAAELERLEQEIGRAWVASDRASLDHILMDDWTVIDIAGRIRTKKEILEEMFGPDGSRIEKMDIDDVHVRLMGDVAVVTGRTLAVGRDGTTMRLRFTDVAVLRDGSWRVAASQGTPILK